MALITPDGTAATLIQQLKNIGVRFDGNANARIEAIATDIINAHFLAVKRQGSHSPIESTAYSTPKHLDWDNGHGTMSLNLALDMTDGQLERTFRIDRRRAEGAAIRLLLLDAAERGMLFVPTCPNADAKGMCGCKDKSDRRGKPFVGEIETMSRIELIRSALALMDLLAPILREVGDTDELYDTRKDLESKLRELETGMLDKHKVSPFPKIHTVDRKPRQPLNLPAAPVEEKAA